MLFVTGDVWTASETCGGESRAST